MALQKNLISQVTYSEGGTPNATANYGVTNVARTSAVPAGSWDVSLQGGYSAASDAASLQILGDSPGLATVEPVPGNAGQLRVRTWNAAGVLADRPWTLTVYRNALLTGSQDL